MPEAIIMPKFDMDQEKATIISWLKSDGDPIQRDEPILTVETDKVSIEVPAPGSGRLAGICAHAGDVVPVTQVIGYILKEGESEADLPSGKTSSAASHAGPSLGQAGAVKAATPGETVAATPVARRMAEELGLDLSQVPAARERITREDIERFTARAAAPAPDEPVAATPAARRLARELKIGLQTLSGSGPLGRVQAADVAAAAPGQPVHVEPTTEINGRAAKKLPLAGMRQRIAERMQASFHEAPHISLSIELDVQNLEALRGRLNEVASARSDPKITLTALLVCIAAWALERQPLLNASLLGDQIYLWEDVNIGVATALPEGLIVPVIRQANRRSISQIAAAVQDLTTRAREGKLALADVQAGTFTISNLGMFGIQQFRAILNPPESGILAVGAVTRKPVVIDERDTIAVRPMMTLTLAADHRVVDGAIAAQFLAEIATAVKNPDVLQY